MTRNILRSLCLSAAILFSSCAGDSPPIESGSQCWDGKDNDGDRLIDCKDSDCGYLEICGQQPDLGVPDEAVFPQDNKVPDKALVPDQAPPDLAPPDTAPSGTYGSRCQYDRPPPKLCADGQTYCVPTGLPPAPAFCTHKCASTNQQDSCPATPDGQRAVCIFEYNHQPYCLFVCKFGGQTYDCPDDLTCEAEYPTQSHCY